MKSKNLTTKTTEDEKPVWMDVSAMITAAKDPIQKEKDSDHSAQGAASLPPEHFSTQSTRHPGSSTSDQSGKSTKTRVTRHNPAIQEVFSSSSSIFQEQEFDRLRQHYQHHEDIGKEIQQVSDTLDESFQALEQNLDALDKDE